MFSRLFHIGGQKVLGMYSNRKGVVYAEPQGTSHLAHVIWKNPLTGKDSNIDYFLAKDSKLKPSEARMIKPQADKGAEDKFQFRYQLLSSLKDFEWLARDIAVADVNSFIESRIALHGSSSERRLLIYLEHIVLILLELLCLFGFFV